MEDDVAKKIQEFHEYLDISNILTDILRFLGWAVVRGLAWFTDGLENITDEILLLRNFYQNEDIVSFVEMIKPFLFILLAFSILYAGYLLIFQKKFNREGMIINVFIACIIILLLGTGMDKAGEFTDVAIDTIKTGNLVEGEEDAKLSDTIIKQGITDLMMFDKNDWATTEIEKKNMIATNKIKFINPKERFTEKDTDLKLTTSSIILSKSLLTSTDDGFTSTKLDQSGLSFNNEFYFRYSIQWIHILVSLGVISFTLLSIAIKLARLFFELTFNYLLAIIIAPADVHDGQKTKTIIQSIMNIFIVTILIFMSMKIYIIGMGYLDETLDGIAYLIALVAFSLAVIDAPNIIERLFGIDGGLKSGWGLLTGTYIGGKMATGLAKGAYNNTLGKAKPKPMRITSGGGSSGGSGGGSGASSPSSNQDTEQKGNNNPQKNGSNNNIHADMDKNNTKTNQKPNNNISNPNKDSTSSVNNLEKGSSNNRAREENNPNTNGRSAGGGTSHSGGKGNVTSIHEDMNNQKGSSYGSNNDSNNPSSVSNESHVSSGGNSNDVKQDTKSSGSRKSNSRESVRESKKYRTSTTSSQQKKSIRDSNRKGGKQ